MVEAVCRQARTLSLAPPNADFPAKRELAERLLGLAPSGFTRVFFALGGAEAVENAMKLCRLSTGRFKFVSRYRSYHGASLGALSLTGDHRRPPLEPLLSGVTRVLDDSHIPEVLEREGRVAGVFLEAVPGANGVLVGDVPTWQAIRAACDDRGALLVVDEVLTGFGRTGRAFGFEHFEVLPDLIVCGKALTAGYAPLSAVLVHERVAERFEEEVLWAGLTHYAHPLGCAAGVEALAIYEDEGLYARADALGTALRGGLSELAAALPEVVSEPRGLGLLAAVDIEAPAAAWRAFERELSARHLHVHLSEARGTLILAPPLVIGDEVLARGLNEVRAAASASLGL